MIATIMYSNFGGKWDRPPLYNLLHPIDCATAQNITCEIEHIQLETFFTAKIIVVARAMMVPAI